MSRYLEHDWFPEPLPDNVQLGERTWLYSTYAFRHYRSRQTQGLNVGNDTGLYNGTFFDLGPDGQVEIGNFCTLVGAIICSNARVVIQDYALIAHEVVIADQGASIPDWGTDNTRRDVTNRPGYETRNGVFIGQNAWIGARAILLGGAHIGEGAIVGAAAVVNFKVPDFAIVAGNPARIVGQTRRNATNQA
jgi:acetyltransferase-like isoleucine patch superfamily enzyme